MDEHISKTSLSLRLLRLKALIQFGQLSPLQALRLNTIP
jgi:hypothetical protein